MAVKTLATPAVSELAQSRQMREALQWLTREKQWITETHLQLCRIPAPTFLEQDRAAWMLSQFRELGCTAHIDQTGNVIAAPEPIPDEQPIIAITAHLDTVFAPRLKEDIYIDSDGRLKGPGVADNGPGLVALLAIARAVKTFGTPDDAAAGLLFVANVGEEGEGNLSGFRFLCGKSPLAHRIAAFLVLDGATTDHIIVRALGSRRFDLTFTGPGGHSWSDFGTGNPVHALAHAIAFFTDTRLDAHPRSSINVGVIEAGGAVNSIAAEARAKVDIRSESNEKINELVAVLHECVERAQEIENHRATTGKVVARLKEIGSRPAAQLPEKSPILAYLRAVDAHLGIRAQLECSSTDANIPLSLNIPAISIGAGGQGGGAHTIHEWFNPEGRDLGLKRILLTAAMLLRFGAA
jgi:acetylornithine deacetylase/succinyl-diaminopimelate desuccinylase-like protein